MLLAGPRTGADTTTAGTRSSCCGVKSAGSCVGGGCSSLDVFRQHLGSVLSSETFRVHGLSQGGDVLVVRSHLLWHPKHDNHRFKVARMVATGSVASRRGNRLHEPVDGHVHTIDILLQPLLSVQRGEPG